MSYSTPAPTIPCAPYFSKTVNVTAEASGATISGTERASHRRQTARKVEYGITARKECALGLWRLLLTNDIGVASPGHLSTRLDLEKDDTVDENVLIWNLSC